MNVTFKKIVVYVLFFVLLAITAFILIETNNGILNDIRMNGNKSFAPLFLKLLSFIIIVSEFNILFSVLYFISEKSKYSKTKKIWNIILTSIFGFSIFLAPFLLTTENELSSLRDLSIYTFLTAIVLRIVYCVGILYNYFVSYNKE